MVWTLLRRGLVVGALAGLLAGAFAFAVGEPLVQDAIELERAASAHAGAGARGAGSDAAAVPLAQAGAPLAQAGEWVVTRPGQRGGLFLATALYGLAAGGLFAIAFATLRGRGSQRSDWQLATRLAAAIFVAIVLVPFLKYPPNPPAVGDPQTIGDRSSYYLILLAGSALAMLAAARVAWSLRGDRAPWVRPLALAGTFIAVAGGLALSLPGVSEIPPGFPAQLIWEFRLSSLGTQAVLWAALGTGYGIAMHRAAPGAAGAGARSVAA